MTLLPNCSQHKISGRCSRVSKYLIDPRSAGLMPTEARGNYLAEAPYLRETKR